MGKRLGQRIGKMVVANSVIIYFIFIEYGIERIGIETLYIL